MRHAILATLAAGLAACVLTNARAETLDVTRFRQLRAEGVAAANSGDFVTAVDRLNQAAAMNPGHPGLILTQARVSAAAGRPWDAVAHLARYADLGLTADLSTEPALVEAIAEPDFAPVSKRLILNRATVGTASAVLRDDQLHLLEGLAWSRGRGTLLVSSIRDHTIYRIDAAGRLEPYLTEPQSLGIYGLAIDEERDRLWAAATGSTVAGVADGGDAGRTELLEIELSSGRVLARHAPPWAERRNFGDVAVARDGTVSVSDSTQGEVFLLRPGSSTLEPLIERGAFASPQGMVFSPDGRALLIADYGVGLYRIDVETREVSPVVLPEALTLIATDGMAAADDGAIWLVQNGISPSRLMRLELTPDWRSVAEATVEAANLDEMDQPSGVAVGADRVLLIQQSQWGRFDDDGRPRADRTDAAVVSALPLTHAAR